MPKQYAETELAWAAGFFDGEGTICVTKRDCQLVMAVSQAGNYAPEILERFRKAVGVGKVYLTHGIKRKEFYKQGYSWRTSKLKDVEEAFELLKPYLSSAKLEQGEKALSIFINKPRQRMTSERGQLMAAKRWLNASGL